MTEARRSTSEDVYPFTGCSAALRQQGQSKEDGEALRGVGHGLRTTREASSRCNVQLDETGSRLVTRNREARPMKSAGRWERGHTGGGAGRGWVLGIRNPSLAPMGGPRARLGLAAWQEELRVDYSVYPLTF